MNILFITWNYPPTPGGVVGEITRHLAASGHGVQVLVPWRRWQKRSENMEGVEVRRVFVPRRPARFMVPLFMARILLFLLFRRFDAVHMLYNANCFLLPLFGGLLFKDRKMKYVLHQITFSIAPEKGRREAENAKVVAESRYFDAVVTSNRHMVEKYYARDLRDKVFTVRIGVNTEHFKPAPSPAASAAEKKIFPAAGRVFVYQGTFAGRRLEVLLRAFGQVLKRQPDSGLLMIGSGDGAASLEKLAGDLGIGDKVRFTGMVPYDEVPRYMKMADAGVSSIPMTEYYDVQTPLKTMEFLACGLPVIATGTKANRDLVKDGYNGLLVKDDEASLAGAMIRLAADGALREELARNARASVMGLDWKEIVGKELLPAYRRILQ